VKAASRAGTTSLEKLVQSLNGKVKEESSLLSQAMAIIDAAFERAPEFVLA
jgi:hypothetical protein